MSKPKAVQIAFVLMGIFIIEIIGLMQAIFSEQVIKYDLETQIEYASEMLLSQFVASYSANGQIQDSITALGYNNFDEGLIRLYQNLRQLAQVKTQMAEAHYLSNSGLYEVEILSNNEANRQVYRDRLGVDISEIKSYKILSYEMKQGDRQLLERRILVGLSADQKWLITAEINQKDIQTQMDRTKRTMAGLLNSAYYFSDKTGNFYVFSSSGKVLYQGGLQKNASYFANLDLNTNEAVIDLIRQDKTTYQRVIYQKDDEIHRSLIRSQYDSDQDLYFVYEVDQAKAFGPIEEKLRQTWVVGLAILSATFFMLLGFWQLHKRNSGGTL